jgi:hypothetical protein
MNFISKEKIVLILDIQEDFLIQNLTVLRKQLNQNIAEVVVSPYNYVSNDSIFKLVGGEVNILPFDDKSKIARESRKSYSNKVSSLANDWRINNQSIEKFLDYKDTFPAWWFTKITVKDERQKLGKYYFWRTLLEHYKNKEGADIHFIILSDNELCKQVCEEAAIKYSILLPLASKNYNYDHESSSLFEPKSKYSFSLLIFIVLYSIMLIIIDSIQFIKTNFVKKRISNIDMDEKNDIAFVSVYPSWWNKVGSSYAYDRYYSDLPNKLKSRGFKVVLLTLLPNNHDVIKSFRQEIYYEKCSPFFIFESLNDLFSAIRFRLWLLSKLKTILSKGTVNFYGPLEEELYIKELINSLLWETPDRYAFYLSIKNVINKVSVKNIITYDELYNFGRAIVTAAKTNKDIKVYGFQHGIITQGKMTYYYEKRDALKMPIPHNFLVWGKQTIDVMRANEIFGNDFCKIIGGYRFNHDNIPFEKQENKKDFILVVTADQDSYTLPNFIIRHMDRFPLKIIIKPHPTYGEKVQSIVENALQKKTTKQKIEVVDKKYDLKSLLRNNKLLLTTYSTVGIENLCMHTPVITLTYLVPPGISPYEGINNEWLMNLTSEEEFIDTFHQFLNKKRTEENLHSIIEYFIDDYKNSLSKIVDIFQKDVY